MVFRRFILHDTTVFLRKSIRRFHICSLDQGKKLNDPLNGLLLNMPKKKVDVKLRHIRYKERIGGKVPVPSIIDVQVIASGGRGTPRSVMIGTDHCKYLFNCGEGTQRIANEHKMKITKLTNIFITHKSWDNIGGLLGMALTLESSNVPEVIIHGPPGVEKITQMVRAFADANSVKLEKRELNEGYFEDYGFKIDYVPLYRKQEAPVLNVKEKEDSADACGEDGQPERKRRRLSVAESNVTVAYIVRPHAAARKVLLERCVEVGLKPGPILREITSGKSVTLENGKVVHPDEILSPKEEPKPFLVIECPDEDYLEALSSSAQLKQLQSQESVDLVVHMSPSHILDTHTYQQWTKRFGGETQHLMINRNTSEVCHFGLYRIQSQLNLLHPRVFPLLPHLTQTPEGEADTQTEGTVKGCTNLRYQYRPKKGFNREQCFQLDKDSYVDEALGHPDVAQLLENLKSKLKEADTQDGDVKSYPELIFLGTGSSVPSKARNASAIVLNLSESTTILFDCGEGSAGQLYRQYGDKTDQILRNLKAVFISHMHADHHLGLFDVLSERREAYMKTGETCPELLLLAPVQMVRWLDFYNREVESVKDQLRFISLQSLLPLHQERNGDVFKHVLSQLQLSDFLPVEVDHCRNAFGFAIVHKDGWKIVYSGDTMPCDRLVIAGQDCDLLIHEATMEDDLEEEARFKTHSTTSQAIDVGVRMKAKFILLTHFSQRYAKIPVFSDKFTSKVGIAFDNMRVTLKDLPLLPLFNSALKAVFVEEINELEGKRMKRTQKKILMKDLMEKENSSEKKICADDAENSPGTSDSSKVEASAMST